MNRIGNLFIAKDQELFFFLNDCSENKYLKIMMQLFTKLGGIYFNIFLIILFSIYKYNINLYLSQKLFFTLISSHLIVHLLKRKIHRPRPYFVFEKITARTNPIEDYSFPSGHTTAAFSSALVLSSAFSQISLVFFALAFLTAFSRVYLGVHYPSDIFVGIIIALLNYILIINLFF